MSFCGSKLRPAAIGAALLMVCGQWMVAGCCYGLSGAAIGAQAAAGSAVGTARAKPVKGAAQKPTTKTVHSTSGPPAAPKKDPLACAEKNLLAVQPLVETGTQNGSIAVSNQTKVLEDSNQALTNLENVMDSWPSEHRRTLLTSAACPDAEDLRTALKNASDALGKALRVVNEKQPAGVDIASLNQAITDANAAMVELTNPSNAAENAGGIKGAKAVGTNTGPPPSANCPFLSDIKSAQAFLTQAQGTPSLPEKAGDALRNGLHSLLDVTTEWQKLATSSPCDASNLTIDKPAKGESVSKLLAIASVYVAKAAIEAGTRTTPKIAKDLRDVTDDIKTAQDSLAASETSSTSDLVLLCTVGLVFLLALCVAFWSYRQVSRLANQLELLQPSLAETKLAYNETRIEFSSLKGKFEELKKSLEQQEAAVKQFDEGAREDRANAAEEEARETRDSESAAVAFSTPQAPDESASVKASAETDRPGTDATPAVVTAQEPAPEVRDPVVAYNKARGMKSSERGEKFREWYPTQSVLEWVNPAVRASKDASEIRLRDDPFGNLLAVVEGQKAFIFPNFTYNYETGRNSLEGVFKYPPEGVASSTVVEAAVAEKDGDGWRLKTRGEFGG